MNEETPMPYVDWDYSVITEDGEVDDHPRLRRNQLERIRPGSGWYIEFRGRTPGDELLLANYHPSDDEDAREWIQAFESGSSPPVRVSIDTYFGPTDEPGDPLDESDDDPDEPEDESAHPGSDLVDVGHTIYIGHGWAQHHENEVTITIPPEVFRDEAAPRVLGYRSKYEHIEDRILSIFKRLSPQGFADFWEAYERPVYPNDVFSFNDECQEAFWRNRLIRFDRPAGFRCLRLLDTASGEIVTYTMLGKALRPEGVEESVVHFDAPLELKSCISHLRASLKAVDCSFDIDNVRRLGYRFIPSR